MRITGWQVEFDRPAEVWGCDEPLSAARPQVPTATLTVKIRLSQRELDAFARWRNSQEASDVPDEPVMPALSASPRRLLP